LVTDTFCVLTSVIRNCNITHPRSSGN